MPRAGNNLILPPLEETSSNDYTEEEEDELAIYLVQNFAKLRSLEEHDPATFIKDTVQFVIKTTAKENTGKRLLISQCTICAFIVTVQYIL